MFHYLFVFLFSMYLRINFFRVKSAREIQWGYIRSMRKFSFFAWKLFMWDMGVRRSFYYIILETLWYYQRARTPKNQRNVSVNHTIETESFYIGFKKLVIARIVCNSGDCGYELATKWGLSLFEGDDVATNELVMSFYHEFIQTFMMNEQAQDMINVMNDDELVRNKYERVNMGFGWFLWNVRYSLVTAFRKAVLKQSHGDIEDVSNKRKARDEGITFDEFLGQMVAMGKMTVEPIVDRDHCSCRGCVEYREYMQAMTINEAGMDVTWAKEILAKYESAELPKCIFERRPVNPELTGLLKDVFSPLTLEMMEPVELPEHCMCEFCRERRGELMPMLPDPDVRHLQWISPEIIEACRNITKPGDLSMEDYLDSHV